MGKRGGSALHGAMNIMSSVLLCLTFGRLLVVIWGAAESRSTRPVANNPVPMWLPAPQQQPRKDHHFSQQHDYQHHPATNQRIAAYAAGRRGEAMPAEMEQMSNNLRGSDPEDLQHAFGNSLRSIPQPDHGGSSSSSSRAVVGSSSGGGASSATYAWGEGMRVLVFTMDSIRDVVAKSKRGGPAGEIIIRESLTDTLVEAGVQVRDAKHRRERSVEDHPAPSFWTLRVFPKIGEHTYIHGLERTAVGRRLLSTTFNKLLLLSV